MKLFVSQRGAESCRGSFLSEFRAPARCIEAENTNI